MSSTILLNRQSAVSSIFYSTTTFNFDLLTPNSEALIFVPKFINAVTFGENPINTFQDITLTMFCNAHTHKQTNTTQTLCLRHTRINTIQRQPKVRTVLLAGSSTDGSSELLPNSDDLDRLRELVSGIPCFINLLKLDELPGLTSVIDLCC